MKRLLSAIAVLCFSTGVFAQQADSYGIPTHSLNLQVSDGVGELLIDGFASLFGVAAEGLTIGLINGITGSEGGEVTKWEYDTQLPYFTAGYDYHFPESRWCIGGELGYWQRTARTVNRDPVVTSRISFGSAVVTSKLFYKRSGSCKLYGGINAGVLVLDSNGEPSALPAIQLNPIGMRLGSEKAAFVAELGIGYRGILQVGANIAL